MKKRFAGKILLFFFLAAFFMVVYHVEVKKEARKSRQAAAQPVSEIRQSLMEAEAGTTIKAEQLAVIHAQELFFQQDITEEIFARIYGKSWKEECTIKRADLCYVRVLHRGFDGEVYIGELIVNRQISEDILDIFYRLYLAGYPIEKIRLIDEYDANDECSMADNNTSCFNFRTISRSETLSKHSRGLAVDVNPLYNPYLKTVNGELICEPESGWDYADRSKEFAYKINENDLCYQLFIEHGFTWGGDWNTVKDYQHFEKEI